MNLRIFMAGLLLGGVLVAFSTDVFSQEHKEGAAPGAFAVPSAEQQAEMMKQWMQLAAPGENHKHLEALVGEWDLTVKIWMGGPDSPPQETRGTATTEWVLGKRFVEEHMNAQMMGMPFEGRGLTGYDNFQNMYVTSWADSMSTSLTTLRGMRHPQTGIFTFYGLADEPMLKVVGRTIKQSIRIVDENTHVATMYDLHAGDDFKVMEITYTRKTDGH